MAAPIDPTVASAISVDWTIIISVFTISLAAMGTFIKIFGGKKFNTQDDPDFIRLTDKTEQHSRELDRNDKRSEDHRIKHESLRDIANKLEREVEIVKKESDNQKAQMKEIKEETKEIWHRVDELLRQLMEVIND